MRIPPSVFVMSLLVAVPFGLGIRDTLTAKEASADDDDEYGDDLDFGRKRSARASRELAEYEAELAREAAERELRNKERIGKLGQLYGAQPAAMGSLLEGIAPGSSAGAFQPEHVRQRIERESRDGFLNVIFDVDAKSLNAVQVHVNSDYETGDACDKLEEKLQSAWGWSTKKVWIDATTHQRAALHTDDGCMLRFDRYLEANEWVEQLPLKLVGQSVDKLTASIGSIDDQGTDFVTWTMPGLRSSSAATKLEAYVVNNKVAGFKVLVDSDFDTTLAIRDAISTKLKAKVQKDEDTGAWLWKGRPAATLEEIDTDRFALTVGKF